MMGEARADGSPTESVSTAPVPGPGVEGSWELALDGSFQRLSGGVVSSEIQVGTSLGRYVLSWLEPFIGASVRFEHLDGPAGSGGDATDASGGVGARASFEAVDRVRPYLSASPGFLLRSIDIRGVDSRTQVDFVLSVELGAQILLVPRVALDLGVAYDRIFSDRGEDLVTVPLGLSFYF